MISIIIIVKNDRGIENTLNSLKKVKKPEKTEIIVVDASKKETLLDIKKKFPNVRWFYFYNNISKRYTYAEQRNLGINKSRGDIIVFLDADCIPKDNQWLAQLTLPIKNCSEDIVCGRIKSLKKLPPRWDNYYRRLSNSKYIDHAPTGNVSFRKSIIKDIGFFNEELELGGCEDTDFFWRVINEGYRIRYNKEAIVIHDWEGFKKNTLRVFLYGSRRFDLLKKHKKKFLSRDNLGFIYSLFILFLPITLFWPYYPLFLIIPFSKEILETKSFIGAGYNVFLSMVDSIGFLSRGLRLFFSGGLKIFK